MRAGAHHRLQRSGGGRPARGRPQWHSARLASTTGSQRFRRVAHCRHRQAADRAGDQSDRSGHARASHHRHAGACPGLQLTAIFSPEHGVTGTADSTDIANFEDGATGVPVYSVYGDTDAKRRPPPERCASVDVIVFDIQDVGARFYTLRNHAGIFSGSRGEGRQADGRARPP